MVERKVGGMGKRGLEVGREGGGKKNEGNNKGG